MTHRSHRAQLSYASEVSAWGGPEAITTVRGARRALYLVRPPRPIRSAGEYAAICRRLDPTLARSEYGSEWDVRTDGRLIAVGYGWCKPTEWVGGKYESFLRYWHRAAERPNVVMSPYNAHPRDVCAAWRSCSGPTARRPSTRFAR